MSYTKQTWETGDTITKDKLNHMESGIESSGGVVVITPEVVTTNDGCEWNLKKSYNDLVDIIESGKVVYFNLDGGVLPDYANFDYYGKRLNLCVTIADDGENAAYENQKYYTCDVSGDCYFYAATATDDLKTVFTNG